MVNLPEIIQFLNPTARTLIDFTVSDNSDGNGGFISFWNTSTLGQQPSQATLDATAVSAPFLAYLAEHGGDAALTFRRLAKEAFNRQQELEAALRAVIAVALDEVNNTRQWIADFKVQVAAATTLADLKTRVAALPNMPQRTLAQARTAVLAKIDAGTVDT